MEEEGEAALSVWRVCTCTQPAEVAGALEATPRRYGSGAKLTPPPEVTEVMAVVAEVLRMTSPLTDGMVVAVATATAATVAAAP